MRPADAAGPAFEAGFAVDPPLDAGLPAPADVPLPLAPAAAGPLDEEAALAVEAFPWAAPGGEGWATDAADGPFA